MNRNSTFKEQLEGKKSANFILAIITGVVSVGLILYCLVTKSFSLSYGPLYFLILLFGSLTTFFLLMLNKIKKYEQNPNEFFVYDSFVVDKKTEQSRYQYSYSLFVKREKGKPFRLIVDPQEYNSYYKNARILAIKDAFLGGFILTEEECKKYGFQVKHIKGEN